MSSDQASGEIETVVPHAASEQTSTSDVPASLQLIDVETALAPKLRNPHLPFLTRHPTLVRVLMIQPLGTIVADEQKVRVQDRATLVAQMKDFLTKAKERNVDLAACPEYSCPWDALTDAVQADVFPSAGTLWALGCESATPDQLAISLKSLSSKVTVIFDGSVLQAGGNFLDLLVYLFRTQAHDGHTEVMTALIQAKTQAMGGTPFEQQNLKIGHILYRFRNSIAES